ncbi:unnamed protein product [Boreogadus saida]
MPKFKLPKFGTGSSSITAEMPEVDKQIKFDAELNIPKATVDITAPKVEVEGPSIDLKSTGTHGMGKGSKIKMPRSSSITAEIPEVDKQIKFDAELNIPKATVDITAPKVEGPSIDLKIGLFKFPRFGFSTPPGRSPESLDEDLSTAGSMQSSDAFADASSTATSEHTGVSFTSPSKVTVTYSGPDAAVELGALHSTVITSTTRTAQISFEPNLPEMITILSSGVSSSSVDTLKLESDQIHVIRSNIQATPQVQKSTILTNFNVQSPLEMSKNPEFREATSWFEGAPQVEHSGVASVERHITREVSSQEMRTLSRGTVVITQQLTGPGDQVEPIAEDTAGSVKRLRDTVHSEKMRFFEGAHP